MIDDSFFEPVPYHKVSPERKALRESAEAGVEFMKAVFAQPEFEWKSPERNRKGLVKEPPIGNFNAPMNNRPKYVGPKDPEEESED